MTSDRLNRIKFRAWHRGTREADYMIGCFFDRFHAGWSETEIVWFEELIEEEDHDILAWALGTAEVPERYAGELMSLIQKLDYVEIPR
ncbi:succinate dehydrogenase assembly factor 2 [Novosphingobium sp. G106]|uniref:FAD assembly factor SdhE n=1 Tax=Novosphingobium sp. G106 TaxID=2849500 RepID=UPI001C2D2D1C|nr:succinate dehydrogenase assembly factor 2 [Novosphingobium sp. G106]MBV1687068.1 succinate dehydrogenase assembly factor 2 [Novosphingobium sp. G106]